MKVFIEICDVDERIFLRKAIMLIYWSGREELLSNDIRGCHGPRLRKIC